MTESGDRLTKPVTDSNESAAMARESKAQTEHDSAARKRDIRWVFFGSQGLRAGWGVGFFIAAFAAVVVVLRPLLVRLLHFNPKAAMRPTTGILAEGIDVLILVAVLWLMSRIERRPLLSYGYQGRARLVRLVSGLLWGFVAISALVLTLWGLGYARLEGTTLMAGPAIRDALLWGVMFCLVGFFEESVLRGYLQLTLTRGIGFWWGALLFSVLFGAMHGHNPGESPVGLFSAGAVGLVFCISLWYTGSLWWAIGFHAAWDWGESYFYGTADSGLVTQGHLLREHSVGNILMSGGATGPEGSLLIVPLLVVMAALMVLWWRGRAQSPFAGAGWKPLRHSTQESATNQG